MSHTSKTKTKKHTVLHILFGGAFVFVKDIYRYIIRKNSERRVQKMLKNNFVVITQKTKKPKKTYTYFTLVPQGYRGVAAIFSVSFLILTILTSQYYGPQFIEAEILAQNFTQNEAVVNEGIELLKYETESINDIDAQAEFDAGVYTNGNFEAGVDDMTAIADTDDYLTLGHYGDVPPDTTYNDWWAGEKIQTCSATSFQQGTFSDTQWDISNDWAELTSTGLSNGIGTYESEVIDAGTSVAWSDIVWTSTRPTYKELPNNLGAENFYSAGNVDMAGNLLTMHFNELASTIVDSSGVTGSGTYNGALTGQSGRFNTALGFDGVDDHVDFGQDLSSIIGGTGSVAFWMNTTQVGSDTAWEAPGITGSESSGDGNDVFWGYINAAGHIAIQAGDVAGTQSTTIINDGQWHHVVLTRDYITGVVEVYVDGSLENSTVSDTGLKTQYFNSIGRIYDSSGTHGWYQGLLDEVSFWSDVMTPTQAYDHYRRGANRLKFQVRSCDDAVCSGETFIGPDGTSATYYTEELNSTVHLPALTLAHVSDNQYLQWRVEFETDNDTMSPELLCVTFNNGDHRTWNYRKCFDVDHTAAGTQDEQEYQIYLDTDTQSLVSAGTMQSDGSDMRFVDSDGNILSHYIADDMNTLSTRIWLKMDNIDAGNTEEICMYYGNSGASTIASREDVFTYDNQEDIYYVVAGTAQANITDIVSYTDDNTVTIGSSTSTIDAYERMHYPSDVVPTFTQTTSIRATDPINAGYNANGTDNLVPARFAGTSFVYRMDRYTNAFSFVSPWCSADVTVRNSAGTIVTGGTLTVAQGTSQNLTTTDVAATGIPNDGAVMIEVTNGCPILASHHSTASQDSFVMIPAALEWYGVGSGALEIAAITDSTTVTVYRSDNTTASYSLSRGQHVYVNDTGTQGTDPAHHVVANLPVGVKAIADGDGNESVTFMPVGEMGYRHYIPESSEYIAVATKAGISTTVDLYSDGTQCGVGTPTTTYTVTSTGNYPGKVLFGAAPAGACVIANNPISAYYETVNENDEHNLWSEVQNRQFIYPTPTYSVGTQETGTWSINGTDTWTRRVPITISNTSTTALTEYQMKISLGTDVASMFGKTQADGGDIRVAGSLGNGTDNIVYSLENFNSTSSTGDLWIKFPSVAASATATAYIYYYPVVPSQIETCSQAEFNNGTYTNTQWDATNNWTELTATGLTSGTGQYTSEIFDAGASTVWSNLSWESHRPTFKELPNNEGTESVYGAGNIDMTDNVLLLHMNETSGTIVDSSGNGNDGTYNGTGYSAAGRFNTGLDFDGTDDEIVIPDDNSLDITGEVTAAAWIYLDTISGWQSFFHKNINTSDHQEIYFEQNAGRLYNYNTINTSSAVLTAGQWYHIAYTANATTETIYVNGQSVVSEAIQYGGTSNTYDLVIGGSGGGGEQVNGRMDEAAMWSRALSATEINSLYLRGANRLNVQVRSCDDAACSGETFIGPDGTTATYYTEQTNNTINYPANALTNVINNRYFQYQYTFNTSTSTQSPELTCVSVDNVVLQTGFSTTGDHNAVFRTTTPKANYYIVDSLDVAKTMSVISFANGNSISDGVTTRTVDQGKIVTLPFAIGVSQSDQYSVTGPLHVGFVGDATDSAIPISYAGKEFVYRVDAGTDVFSFYAPFANASVQIQQSSTSGWTTLQTVSVSVNTAVKVTQDIVNGRAFKIVSDQPILGFRQGSTNNSFIMYPTNLGLEQDSGKYELYGVGSGSMRLAASSTANVTLYRGTGTTSNITLNAANNFVYTESGSGAQGTGYAYHIISDAPIGATSYNDGDGTETVTFLSQKEFSKEYVLSNPAQYMSIVAKDPSVTCRVYNASGTEVTTDATGTMNNIPPQIGGTRVEPYPNKIFIGGSDTSDGALFAEGYRLSCTEPVYAYYEHHLSTTISDETSWLTWPQVRKRAYVEPIAEDIDSVDEQGLFYPSGIDSASTAAEFEAFAEYTLDTSALIYGEHTYWRSLTWEEIINSRSGANSVDQVSVEIASGSTATNCTAATFGSYTPITPTVLTTTIDASLPYVTYTTNTQHITFDDAVSDNQCVKVKITLKTGDQVYAPQITNVHTHYYIPTLLEDQLNNPTISVVGATDGTTERYRVLKAITHDSGLNNSQAFTAFTDGSNNTVFTQADTDLFDVASQATNPQFTFPPFPGTLPVDATTQSQFDSTHDLAVYFTHERTTGSLETLDYTFNVDIAGLGGPQLSRDFQLEVGGL